MIHMTGKYKSKLKQRKPRSIVKLTATEETYETLNACFDMTDWSLFVDDCVDDVNRITDVVSSYITFCRDLHMVKKIKIYNNNKPWMSTDLRECIIGKHRLFGTPQYNVLQKKLSYDIKAAKINYKQKIEELFKTNNMHDAWKGLKTLTGMEKKHKEPAILGVKGSADRLNSFYARFNDKDFKQEHHSIKTELAQISASQTIELPENCVRKVLNNIKVKKAEGPDGISGMLIKSCKDSLLSIIEYICCLSLNTAVYPAPWKLGKIIPVAKKDLPEKDNDMRPVTLTAILSKCLERVGLAILKPYTDKFLDPLQFAYVQKRSTDDAVATLVHLVGEHLDRKSSNTARTLFIDFSSAFNTLQPHKLLEKLGMYRVPEKLRLWILDYLLERPQFVQTRSETSAVIKLDTGSPQGCALSPYLFILYTNDMKWHTNSTYVVKYADDTAIVGLIENDNDKDYCDCINFVNRWCCSNYLDLNVSKTKEVIWDFRKNSVAPLPISINDMVVEKVKMYKYLGVLIDHKLSFADHVDSQLRKANKRLYGLRTLRKLNVDLAILVLFYNTTISSVLSYACSIFYAILTVELRETLEKPERLCIRFAGTAGKDSISTVKGCYRSKITKMGKNIADDTSHPLNKYINLLPSGRRYRKLACRTTRFQRTFVPKVIEGLNEALKRNGSHV